MSKSTKSTKSTTSSKSNSARTLKIYGHPASGCTTRTLATLFEVGLEPSFVLVDLAQGQQHSPGHKELHPFAKVPVLVEDVEGDGDFVLYESQAIMRYVGASLVPEDRCERALMDQYLSTEPSYFAQHAWLIRKNLMLAPILKLPFVQAEVDSARKELGKALDVLERALAEREYLAGTFSLADLTFMPLLQLLVDTKQDDLLRERANVHAWWTRLSSRPSWLKVLDLAVAARKAA